MNHLSIAMLALGTTACVGPDVRFDHVEQEIGCDPFFCGKGNSDVIDNMGLHDLNVKGEVNDTGFRLTKMVKGGVVFEPRVYASELYGYEVGGSAYLPPSEVVGAELVVEHDNQLTYLIKIQSIDESEYWGTPDSHVVQATSYRLLWKEMKKGKWQNLCVEPPTPGHPDLRGNQPAYNAFLFEGDRIDERYKTFEDKPDDDWFNIGCMGHALAKLHLTGHTQAAKRQRGFVSDLPERQTFLKMIVGDYCGSGQPFTVAGQPLDYMNASGTVKYASGGPLEIEARWNPDGATCLNKPRVTANATPESDAAFPNGIEAAMLAAGCEPPPACHNDDDVWNLDGHYLNSANP